VCSGCTVQTWREGPTRNQVVFEKNGWFSGCFLGWIEDGFNHPVQRKIPEENTDSLRFPNEPLCFLLHRCITPIYQVHIIECVLCVGYVTNRHATVNDSICIYKKKMDRHSIDFGSTTKWLNWLVICNK
jgi:hypothetical protein